MIGLSLVVPSDPEDDNTDEDENADSLAFCDLWMLL